VIILIEKYTKFIDIPQSTQDGQWQCNFNLKEIVRQIKEWEEEGLEMNPDFQRGHVWNIGQSRAYIEALLQNRAKNARTIYLNHIGWMNGFDGDFVCVDGLQRYTAIRMFIENKIDVFRTDKRDNGYYYGDGTYYNEFEDSIRICTATIVVNINTLQTKKEVLRWYIDLNTGGVVHSSEEIERVKKLIKVL